MALNERETAIAWVVFCAGITRPQNIRDMRDVTQSQTIFNIILEKGRQIFFPSISRQELDRLFKETTIEIMRIETMLADGRGT